MASSECERLRPYLVDFVVGELGPEAQEHAADIKRHLAECAECRAAAEELRGTGRALEAVKVLDVQLAEEVRKNITSRARLEAQKVRATRRHGRISEELRGRVPAAAWVVLALGAAAALAVAALLPGMGLFEPPSAGEVLACEGGTFKEQWPAGRRLERGQQITVPAGAILCLSLCDHSRLFLRGPAEVKLAGRAGPLELAEGEAYIEPHARCVVALDPLRKLELGAGSKVSLKADPVSKTAALVVVLAGSADYSASGGAGQAAAGKTLVVDRKSGSAELRASLPAESAPRWRNRVKL